MSGAASDGKTVKIHFRVEKYFDPVLLEPSRDLVHKSDKPELVKTKTNKRIIRELFITKTNKICLG
jgi:hypothetical protein